MAPTSTLYLVAGPWISGPVRMAVLTRDRFSGLRSKGWDGALLLRGRSVHGIGLQRRVLAVGLDEVGTVLSCALLERGNVMTVRGARWILELPESKRCPPVGARLIVRRFLS